MWILLALTALALAEDTSAAHTPLPEAFPPPAGSARIPAEGFGAWLSGLTLAAAADPVRTYRGDPTGHHARVIELPLVPGDLQQCADSILRLRAEYLRSKGAPISFFATSGDPIPWSRYHAGERPHAEGNHLVWSRGGSGSWEGYLATVFTWAGTRSLSAHETRAASPPVAGEILVTGGSPGHAVLLLDVAAREDGSLLLLVGEGFMPAQDFHVELGPVEGWWEWGAEGLVLPYWSFPQGALRSFPAP